MKKQILLLFALICPLLSKGQEVFINADFVSSYMWRGIKCGSASVQPTLGVTIGGFTLSTWASTEFSDKHNEIDLTLEYEYRRLKLILNNVFYQAEGETFNYFNYQAHSTKHTFELGAEYVINKQVPLKVAWYTIFAGKDYRENGKRAWSSYCQFSYPFCVKDTDLKIEAGFTPWEGTYADKFTLNNIALTASRSIQITEQFALPLFGKLGFNPYESTAYFVVGISL